MDRPMNPAPTIATPICETLIVGQWTVAVYNSPRKLCAPPV
jgi:hypothetical protein